MQNKCLYCFQYKYGLFDVHSLNTGLSGGRLDSPCRCISSVYSRCWNCSWRSFQLAAFSWNTCGSNENERILTFSGKSQTGAPGVETLLPPQPMLASTYLMTTLNLLLKGKALLCGHTHTHTKPAKLLCKLNSSKLLLVLGVEKKLINQCSQSVQSISQH